MKKSPVKKQNTVRLTVCALLAFSFILSLVSPLAVAEASNTLLDLAVYSERYLSDFAIADGGSLSFDERGNILFDIHSAANSLRFKCTGAYSSGEQNAVCIKTRNETGSTKMSVEIVFMDYNSNLHTEVYEKTVSNASNDSYIFIQSPENLFVTSITLKATGVGAGKITVMGIWHCYYYFGEDGSNTNVGSINRLEYVNGGSSVHVEGSIHHDITISSKNSKIELYRLLPGEEMSEDFLSSHSPCAQSLMSRSFSFSVPNKTGDDYASAYALVIISESGKLEYVIEDKRYPRANTAPADTEVGFKGISTSLEFLASKTSSDTLLIDIYTDEVISDRLNGYLYSFCGESYCFDSGTVNSIDRRITSASSDQKNIYFRLTSKKAFELYGTPGTVYDADGENAKKLYALISFLSERYSSCLGGIVVGSKFDTPHTYADLANVKYEEYLRKYSEYLSIVCAALQNADTNARVILPLSSNNSRIYGDSVSEEKYPMSAMLISLLELYSHINNATLTLMVCDDSFPDHEHILSNLYGGTARSVSSEEDFRAQSGEIMNISSENPLVFEDLIRSITEFFDFIDSKYFFAWESYGIYDHREYETAYAYNYFNLCDNKNVYSFICDFSGDELLGSYEKSDLMTDVITVMGGPNAKDFIDNVTWTEWGFTFSGISGYDRYVADNKSVISLSHTHEVPTDHVGIIEFSDLSKPSTLSSWKPGAYTDYISMASVLDGKRSLKSLMTLPYYSSEFAEIVFFFDKKADLSSIDTIVFSLMIDSEDERSNGEYTVRTVVGGGGISTVAESNVIPVRGESFILSLDVSALSEIKDVSYIKIGVQNNSGKDDRIITNVLSISAYSKTHTSEQLKEIFKADESENTQSTEQSQDERWKSIAIMILFVVAVFAIFAINIYRRNALEEGTDV